LPIFDRGLRGRDLQESVARLHEAEASVRESELAIRQELREAGLAWETAVAGLETAREQLALARRSWEAVQTAFGVGAASPLEVADAAATLRNAEMGLLAQAVGLGTAELRLGRAGGLAEPLELDGLRSESR